MVFGIIHAVENRPACVAAVGNLRENLENPVIHRPYNIILSSFILSLRRCQRGEMGDLLWNLYPWVKALHVMAVIAWMAGLFYLPRLFVYHTEQVVAGSPTAGMFRDMERRLLQAIMTPAALAAWLFGLILVATPGVVDWSLLWPWTKAGAVLAMSWFHLWLAARRKDFMSDSNRLTGRQYRMMNEVPTLFMIIIVLSVIVKF